MFLDEPPDAAAVIVLLEDNIVTIDLKTEGFVVKFFSLLQFFIFILNSRFPLFKHHHSTEIHESPISFTDYLIDPDLKLIQHLFALKDKETKASTELPKYSNLVRISFKCVTTKSYLIIFLLSKTYPICGGLKSSKPTLFPYYELVVTG